MILHAPQLIYIALILIGLGLSISRHGEPRTGKHDLTADIIAGVIVFSLLYWGGFFG